jgi:hypothetical protein
VIIFASGVSNSKETNNNDFNREIELISKVIDENKNLKFIYFSCVLVNIVDNDYFKHKLNVESIIKQKSNNYLIFRIPQIIGNAGNKNNLVNYFKKSIKNGDELEVFNETKRALIDVDDLVKIISYCKSKISCNTLIISDIEKIDVIDIVNLIGENLKTKPIIKTLNKNGDNWDIKNSEIIDEAINNLHIDSINYTKKIITKYINN